MPIKPSEHPRIIIKDTPPELWGIAITAAEVARNFGQKRTTLWYMNKTRKALVIKNKASYMVVVSQTEDKEGI